MYRDPETLTARERQRNALGSFLRQFDVAPESLRSDELAAMKDLSAMHPDMVAAGWPYHD